MLVMDRERLLRRRDGGEQRVTFFELFFDLVFVFAITQLSHLLLDHLTLQGAFQTAILLAAVWWSWMYTTWMTNRFDPDRVPVRLLLIGIMFISLVMSSAIPAAFEDRGLIFAVSYAAIHIGRPLAIVFFAGSDHPAILNFLRILLWCTFAGIVWIVGGFVDGWLRSGVWIAALAIDFTAPLLRYHVPGLGRSVTADWSVNGRHLAERCQLFLILALGESIIITGATFGDLDPTALTVAALAMSFLGSVALWWIYFHYGSEAGTNKIVSSPDPGRLAQTIYTYGHLPLVAGVIVVAVADELVIAHPSGHIDTATIVVLTGGIALFLAGYVLFQWLVSRTLQRPSIAAIAILAILGLAGSRFSPLQLSLACTLVVVAAAIGETIGTADDPIVEPDVI